VIAAASAKSKRSEAESHRSLVISPGLLERKSGINPHMSMVPEGVDSALYERVAPEPADLAPIPRPRIGYTGVLKRQLDWQLLHELGRRHPQWSFVYVGPRSLPPERFSEDEWRVLAAIIELLPLAAAELQVVFGETGRADYASFAAAARQALGTDDQPTDLAVTLDAELGVDVEHVRAVFASEDIGRSFFSRAEVDVFNALPPQERVAAFFRCWTRKEAYIKAIGKGLSQALDEFDVTLAPEVAPALLRAKDDDATRWWLTDVDVGEGYAGALAVERPVAKVRFFRQDLS
jgi:phosphopantetheine--protein transferase-like protein